MQKPDPREGIFEPAAARGRPESKMVEFLQAEHAVMLLGLHGEIETLQKKCADMQFQLVFHGIQPQHGEDCSVLQDKVEELEAKLAEAKQQCVALCTKLDHKSAEADHLENRLRQQEERYHEDVSARNLIVARLRKEVQEKANTISNLVKLLRVCPDKGPNLNRDEVLRKAEVQTSTLTGPLLTVFSPRETGSLNASSHRAASVPRCSSGSSRNGAHMPSMAASSLSCLDLGKQLVEKYCRSSHNGNPAKSPLKRSDSLGIRHVPRNGGGQQQQKQPDVADQPLALDHISILEPWSPHNVAHHRNGAPAT